MIRYILKSYHARVLLILLVLPGISGCATIISGSSQDVKFISDPPGALVKVGDVEAVTPATLALPRSRFHVVQISKDGYHTAEVALRTEEHPVQYLNMVLMFAAIIPCFVGIVVDNATGARWQFNTEMVTVHLTPVRVGETPRIESKN